MKKSKKSLIIFFENELYIADEIDPVLDFFDSQNFSCNFSTFCFFFSKYTKYFDYLNFSAFLWCSEFFFVWLTGIFYY